MALSNEDHKDVKGALGKAMANKIKRVTTDNRFTKPTGGGGFVGDIKKSFYEFEKKREVGREKRRSKQHFKKRVLDTGSDPAKTKAVRRFVEKTFKGYKKRGNYSREELMRRSAITGPVVRGAEKRGFGNYIY